MEPIIDLTITGNDSASSLQSRIKEKEDENSIIELLMEEIALDPNGFIYVTIVFARGDIDFTGKDKLLNYFVPRLRNLLQQVIQKLKEDNNNLEFTFKKLQLDLINRYQNYAFKGIS